jgi:hypothetical protein
MALEHCTEEDRQIIGRCLRASVEGPFFDEWEFQTLFGITRAQVAQVLKAWPAVDGRDKNVDLAVHNSLGQLLGYPHREKEAWEQYIAMPKERVRETLRRWKLPP